MKNITNHPSIRHTQDVNDICAPLRHLNITYFSHVHISNMSSFSAICTNPAFMEHYLQCKYYNADIHLAGSAKFNEFVIWDMVERGANTEKMGVEALQFGVDHTFTIIKSGQYGKATF